MLEESSSVFCFTVRGQITPQRYQRNPSKMAVKHESETARLDSLELKNHVKRFEFFQDHASNSKENGFTLLAL